MCEIAGEFADGVLLNWLTPAYLPVLAQVTRNAASRAGRPAPWIGSYVRTALAGPALVRLTEEAERYESYPQYAAHFERMGVSAIETCVSGEAPSLNPRLEAFRDADEIVVRAIAAEESLDAYLKLVLSAAPKGSTTS
jgi:alkanesulfonate monooxygenase SsuD/methylene tetrahydromethanopterin reductase-like flavin-dependent oxidoreductase (luciferase family)